MKRRVGALLAAAAMGGCMSANHNLDVGKEPSTTVRASGQQVPMKIPGVSGPWGEPVNVAAPYTAVAPQNAYQAQQMMSQSVPLNWVQMDSGVRQASAQMPGMGMPPGGMMSPPGVPFMPPMMAPGGGMMPPPNMPMPTAGAKKGSSGSMSLLPAGLFGGSPPPGAVAALGAGPGVTPGGGGGGGYKIGRTQVRFAGPEGMRVSWLTQGPDGKGTYSGPVVETPGRYNFGQASIYRLKLTSIRGRPGLEIYPTLEVVPSNAKTNAFLAHSAVPLEFTPEDFQEVAEGKYLVKVIYLPDPQFQELAATGTDTIISTRLEPGADPILEAQRRGSILLVIRMGNVDQEAPNTPSLDSSAACPNPATSMAPGAIPPGALPAPAMAGPLGPSVPMGLPGMPPAMGGLAASPGAAPLPPPPGPPAMPGLPGARQ